MSSPPRTKRDIPPRLPSKKQRSQSLTPQQAAQTQSQHSANPEKYSSADGVIRGHCTEVAQSTHIKRLMSIEKCNSADGVILKKGDENQQPNGQMKIDDKSTSADGVIQHNSVSGGGGGGSQTMSRSTGDIMKGLRFSTQSLSRVQMGGSSQLHSRTPSLNRETSESLSPCIEKKNSGGDTDETDQAPSPPPKPNRSLSQNNQKDDQLGPVQRVASYHASGSDSGNGSGDSAQSSATGEEIQQHRGVIIKNPRFIPNSVSSVTLKSFADIDPVAAEEALLAMAVPVIEQICKFDLENFHTVLLPFNDYRPLDSGTLNTFRMMIGETSPRVIANHMTRIDIRLILGKHSMIIIIMMLIFFIFRKSRGSQKR